MLLDGEDGDVKIRGESCELLHPPVVVESPGVKGGDTKMSGDVLTGVGSAGVSSEGNLSSGSVQTPAETSIGLIRRRPRTYNHVSVAPCPLQDRF